MKRAHNVLELIGATPMVRLSRVVGEGAAEVWGKLEATNPGGSVKDRIALAMIEAAEEQGLLAKGGTIIEPTSGNTGIGLAMVAAYKGYKLIVTMFDTASRERRLQMQAYGAEVVLTPAAEGMRGAIDKALELKREHPDYFLPQQFMNAANPEIHRRTTGREIHRTARWPNRCLCGRGGYWGIVDWRRRSTQGGSIHSAGYRCRACRVARAFRWEGWI